MARISGVDLPKNKRGVIALTYIYGIGLTSAQAILDGLGIDRNTKVNDWSDDNVKQISLTIQNDYTTEGELRSDKATHGYCLLSWIASS
jgi:small subunit ribosomal protein S13